MKKLTVGLPWHKWCLTYHEFKDFDHGFRSLFYIGNLTQQWELLHDQLVLLDVIAIL